MKQIVPRVLAILGCLVLPALAQPLAPAGHAHNDYEHDRPLLDAIDHGFTSVEADIWLRDGELLIGHDESDLDPSRTLQSLYLDPLREQVGAHPGGVFEGSSPFMLLIDVKTDGETTYRALSEVLNRYADILTRREDGKRLSGPVIAIVSGNRPKDAMAAENPTLAFYDGRLSDLDSGLSADFMPLVSDNWTKHFSWTGGGEMPPDEFENLTIIVSEAHARGYKIRFWGTPDRPGPERDALWRVLAEAAVDMINTDDLEGFAAFRSP